MTDQTLTPGSTPGGSPGSTDGSPDGPTAFRGPPAPRRTTRRRVAAGAATAGPFRIVTANVQSFPVNAISLAEALDDLRRNAADGDLVLLQEIAARYRTLVQMAFPASEWVVYYGRSDNSTPIAFRRALFSKVEGRVELLHPAVKHLHFRRYMTHLRLRARDLRFEFHVTNLHLVAGAFNGVDEPDQDRAASGVERRHRQAPARSWRAWWTPACRWSAAATTTASSSTSSRSAAEIAGKPVTYAVDGGSIDLLWFIDGDESSWGVRSTKASRAGGEDPAAQQRPRDAAGHRDPDRHPGHARSPDRPRHARPRRNRHRSRTRSRGRPPHHDGRTRSTGQGAGAAARGGPDARPVRAHHVRRRHPQARRLEDPRRARGGRGACLGYPLTVVQGSYNHGGVSASAGTHDGGGVVDLLAWDWQRKVRVLRKIGFAAWYRPPVSGLWGAHIHAVLIDHGKLVAGRRPRQVIAYRAGATGSRATWPTRSGGRARSRSSSTRRRSGRRRSAPGRREAAGDGTRPRAPYPPKRTLDGVDTSHHQGGRIDLKAARAAGLQWWYVKATEGDAVTDPTYRKRVRQARDGRDPGRRLPLRPSRPRRRGEEARFFLTQADIRAGDMLPMLDLESLRGDVARPQLTAWTGRWVHTVTRQLRRRGLVGEADHLHAVQPGAAASAACCGWPATATTSGRR